MKDIIKLLSTSNIPFKTDMSAALLSAYRGGGNTAIIAYPESVKALETAIRLATAEDIPFMPIGNGTNVLVRDGGYEGIMLSLIGFREITISDNRLTSGSGAGLINLGRFAEANRLSGLEELTGIPGTVGGAALMNAGAFGREISELIESVVVYDCNAKKVRELKREDIAYSYRSSGKSYSDTIILRVTLRLEPGDNVKERCDLFREKRRALQPSAPSLGSVFLKPQSGLGAGYYIEKSGLKGAKIGGAEISEKHANFIINRGGGTASDYISLMALAASVVDKKYGIKLVPEVITVGKE